jgi:hypothetical protein
MRRTAAVAYRRQCAGRRPGRTSRSRIYTIDFTLSRLLSISCLTGLGIDLSPLRVAGIVAGWSEAGRSVVFHLSHDTRTQTSTSSDHQHHGESHARLLVECRVILILVNRSCVHDPSP